MESHQLAYVATNHASVSLSLACA